MRGTLDIIKPTTCSRLTAKIIDIDLKLTVNPPGIHISMSRTHDSDCPGPISQEGPFLSTQLLIGSKYVPFIGQVI